MSDDGSSAGAIHFLLEVKERELALALMRVAELTGQIEKLKKGQLDGVLVDTTRTNTRLLEQKPEVRVFKSRSALHWSLQ